MAIENFQILLDTPTPTYHAGSTVNGEVLLKLNKPKKVRGLRITIKGFAHVSWTETRSTTDFDGDSQNEHTEYSAHEEYFCERYYMTGGPNADITIEAGDNVYPFRTTLPNNLPTAFEGKSGHVRYLIRATLDIPLQRDPHAEQTFQVHAPLDLNTIPEAKEPVQRETSKYFCCCWCRSGPLTLVVSMPQAGVLPGYTIPVCIEVDNASNIEVYSIKLEIIQVEKCFAQGQTEINNKVLDKKVIEGVAANGSKTLNDTILFHSIPFINLKGCSIINVDFILKVTACVGDACGWNLPLVIPLVVGTVPVHKFGNENSFTFFKTATGSTTAAFESHEWSKPNETASSPYFQDTSYLSDYRNMPNASAPPISEFTGNQHPG